MTLLAVQKTLDKGKNQATFTDVPEQKKQPRGFKPQTKEKGLFKYQEDKK